MLENKINNSYARIRKSIDWENMTAQDYLDQKQIDAERREFYEADIRAVEKGDKSFFEYILEQ